MLLAEANQDVMVVDRKDLDYSEDSKRSFNTKSNKAAKKRETKLPAAPLFTASKLHKSPLFPKRSLPSIKTSDYLDYKDYLFKSFEIIGAQAQRSGSPLRVDPLTVMREFTFWDKEGFVWPNILHNNKGGVVLHWVASGYNLRIERLAEGGAIVQTWLDDKLFDDSPSGMDEWFFLNEVIPYIYGKIVEAYHPDWKTFFAS